MPHDTSISSALRRLQASYVQRHAPSLQSHAAAGDVAPGWQALWPEKCVAAIGPRSYRVAIPIVGAVPTQSQLHSIAGRVWALSAQLPSEQAQIPICSIQSDLRRATPRRSYLTFTVAVLHAAPDRSAEAAHVTGLLKNAIRDSNPLAADQAMEDPSSRAVR